MCIVLVHACNCTALTLHLRLHSATGLWRPHRRHWHAAAPSSAGHDAHVLRAWSPGRRHSTARLLRLLLWGRGVALRRHVVRRAVGGATGRVRTEALRVRSVRLQQQNNNASCCVFTSILQCLGCTCTLLKLRCLRYTARCLRCTARCLRYTAQCLLGTLHHALLTLYCARCLRCTAWCAAGPCCARARDACAVLTSYCAVLTLYCARCLRCTARVAYVAYAVLRALLTLYCMVRCWTMLRSCSRRMRISISCSCMRCKWSWRWYSRYSSFFWRSTSSF